MREDIDELADRTCKLLDLVTRAGDEDAGEGRMPAGKKSRALARLPLRPVRKRLRPRSASAVRA